MERLGTLVLGFSGGKDSTATLIYLVKELGLKNVIPVFCDTGWEAKKTYEYLDYIEEAIGIKIERLQATCGQIYKKPNPRVPDPDKKMDMAELSKIKGRFPSSQRRFCTTELKLKVMQKFIDEHPDKARIINVSGVRREESAKRANAQSWTDHDLFLGVPTWLPIAYWTWQQVFDIHAKYDVEPNPLYSEGFSRVGCFPCVMSCKRELSLIARYNPGRFDLIREMEIESRKLKRASNTPSKELSTAFFSHDAVSKVYRRQSCADGFKYANAYDVRDWALGASADNQTETFNFFTDDFGDIEAPACNSIYGLCE